MRFLAAFVMIVLAATAAFVFIRNDGNTQASATPGAIVPSGPIQRCMNLGGALEAPNEGDWGYTIRARDLAMLRAEGFDTVRIPIKWSAHTATEPPYTIDPDFLARVDEIIRWSLANDLNIIIDVHHYDELADSPDAHIPRLYAIWDQLADHWRLMPESVIFELLNEPNGRMTNSRVDEMNADLLARIRLDNPNRWVIVGGAGWGHLEGLVKSDPPRDPRVITTFHFYSPFEFTHQGARWTNPPLPTGVDWGSDKDRREVARTFDAAVAFRERTGMPIFLGEFGVFAEIPAEKRALWTSVVRGEAEARGIGWCYWDWATGFPAYDLENERWLPRMYDALITPPPPVREQSLEPRP